MAEDVLVGLDAAQREVVAALAGDGHLVAQRWAVPVRLADGSYRYLCASGTRRGKTSGLRVPIKALRFGSKADAERVAADFEPNARSRSSTWRYDYKSPGARDRHGR